MLMTPLLRTDEGSETKMTSNNDSVVAVILVGSFINCCRFIHSRHGLPESLTSDNGPKFVATELTEYMKQQEIRHHRVTAKCPQANGEVER